MSFRPTSIKKSHKTISLYTPRVQRATQNFAPIGFLRKNYEFGNLKKKSFEIVNKHKLSIYIKLHTIII